LRQQPRRLDYYVKTVLPDDEQISHSYRVYGDRLQKLVRRLDKNGRVSWLPPVWDRSTDDFGGRAELAKMIVQDLRDGMTFV
jgi:hypothetical protein